MGFSNRFVIGVFLDCGSCLARLSFAKKGF
jgi:hypothetical protein